MSPRVLGALCGLSAAALYGASFAVAKHVQSQGIHFLVLGGLMYLFQAIVFCSYRVVVRIPLEKKLQGRDWKWLAGAALFGGCAGPVLYLVGQERVPAYAASLLAPTEGLFTALVAVLVFRERLSKGEWLALLFIVIGTAVVGLRIDPGPNPQSMTLGAILVLAAFLMWGIDNNCTTRIAHRDPFSIALYKGLLGGALSFAVGLSMGASIPTDPSLLGWIALLGIVNYGFSYIIFIVAMRLLGASRATAFFITNPGFGVLLAWIFLQEQPAALAMAGGGLILGGVYVMTWLGSRKAESRVAPPGG